MQAVILAAGVGSRLSSKTEGKAKCLVEIGGRPLIHHQLEHLADHGVGPVLCVLGYQAEEVRSVVGERAEVIINDRYAETNSLYSLWLARDWIDGEFVLMNSDLFFDPRILDRLLEDSGSVLAYDSTSSRGREQTKVAVKQRRVLDLGKDLPSSSARGESLGILKFGPDGSKILMQTASDLISQGFETAWVIEATRAVCAGTPVYGVNMAGLPWAEIDFPYDLDVARREVWPAIWRSRWRHAVYWKRTRWIAAGLAAMVLALVGWSASTRVGPASIDWETVPAVGGEEIRIEHRDRRQRWWHLAQGHLATADMSGREALIELRLVLPPGSADTLRYVVEILLNNRSVDWRALTAVRDTTAHHAQLMIADRDRVRVVLPDGEQHIGLRLTDGHSDQLLFRIRQPERRDN